MSMNGRFTHIKTAEDGLGEAAVSLQFDTVLSQLEADPEFTCRHLKRWALSEPERIQMARIAARDYPESAARHFREFEISNEGVRLEIASLLVPSCICDEENIPGLRKRAAVLRRVFGNVSLKEEESRFRLAAAVAEDSPENGALLARMLRIKSPEKRRAILYAVAEKRPESAFEALKLLGLNSREEIREVAFRLARTAPEVVNNFQRVLKKTLSPDDRFEIQKTLALSENYTLFVPFVEQRQDEIAEIIVEKCPEGFAKNLKWRPVKWFNVHDEELLSRLAARAVEKSPYKVGAHLHKQRDDVPLFERRRLAYLAAGSRNHEQKQYFPVGFFLDSGEIEDSLFVTALREGHWPIMRFLFRLKDQDPSFIKELIFDHVEAAPDEAVFCLTEGLYPEVLTEEDRIHLAWSLAEQAPAALRFRLLDAHLPDSQLEDLTDRCFRNVTSDDLTLEYVKNATPRILRSKELEIVLSCVHRELQNGPAAAVETLRKVCLIMAAIPSMAEMRSEPISDLPTHERLSLLLECLQEQYRGEYPEQLQAFSAEVRTEEECLTLLAHMISKRDEVAAFDPADRRAVSRFALHCITGMDLTCDLSENTAREIYAQLISLSGVLAPSMCSDVLRISSECFNGEYRDQLFLNLMLFRTVHQMGVTVQELIPAGSKVIDITPESLETLNSDYLQRIDNFFSVRLGLRASRKALETLQMEWGDLTPVAVLAARYSENARWKEEIPVLREVLEECLNGTFSAYKYGDNFQLPMPGEEGRKRWLENPSRLVAVRRDEDLEADEEGKARTANALQLLETNLEQHMPENLRRRYQTVVPDEDFMDRLKRAGNESEIASMLKRECGGDPQQEFAYAVHALRWNLEEGNLERSRDIVSLLNNGASRFGLASQGPDQQQVRADLASIKNALSERRKDSDRIPVIFTTITDHPKLLLTIGDLVDVFSCQNFRIGNMIQCLPGYAIDGNIKGALSFVIPAGKFVKGAYWGRLLTEDPGRIRYQFDPPKLLLRLVDTQTGGEETVFLGKAMRREILRLGNLENGRVCLAEEPAYAQNHGLAERIAAEMSTLVQQVRRNIGAVEPEGTVTFPYSRNPGGVYSDLARGYYQRTHTMEFGKKEIPVAAVTRPSSSRRSRGRGRVRSSVCSSPA